MKKDFTQIAVVLDRSGSMEDVRKQTIDNFNEFVNAQKLVPGEAKLRLVQFDNEYQFLYDKPLNLVGPLTNKTFVPRGSTALRDAIGRTCDELGFALSNYKDKDRPSKVIVLILTDGYENASTQYTHLRVAEIVKHQREKYNWMFVFMGASEDAVMVAQSFNIGAGQAIYYNVADPSAYRGGTVSSSNLMSTFRTTGTIGAFTSTDRTISAGNTFSTPLPTKTTPDQTNVDQDEQVKQGANT